MPAFTADFFGPKNAGIIYGVMLTAWSAGAVVGSLLISSLSYETALFIIAGIMLVSVALPFIAQSLNRRPDTGKFSNVPR
jgi:MFS transporter, OFA family, oxalate/formate antiporter